MCKDGRCGHFDGLQSEHDFVAQLEPVLLKGKKLQLALDAQDAVDRVKVTQAEERDELHHRLAAEVARDEIKMSEALVQVEALADRHNQERDNALKLYTEKLDQSVKGTPLAGLFTESAKAEKALAQVSLTWAKTLGIGIVHKHPDTVRGERHDDDELFTSGDVPDFVRELGEKLAASVGGHLAGIVAVPKD